MTYNFDDKYSYLSDGPTSWGSGYPAPSRDLSTVELDASIKESIVEDITRYLSPATADFYKTNGIPYRRGYLLHGPPGTGKSSLSKALACYFDMSLYCINLGESGIGDSQLRRAFSCLPAKCIVLIEDIDSAGIGREKLDNNRKSPGHLGAMNQTSGNTAGQPSRGRYGRMKTVTLSGLLNALDGASSSEGRIVIMTSNNPEALDSALIRPGRVDKRFLLPDMSRASAGRIFARMYKTSGVEDLDALTAQFASCFPEGKVTPAELQGFILDYRDNPKAAVEEVESWATALVEEKAKESERAREMAESGETIEAEGSMTSEEFSEVSSDDLY